ncbi:hypothetical protein JDV02_010427 [Purpureocillium takamizusanense]|uniref:Ankyrin repeat protein n=1 Tax=Purpureocillium takamizusanense TaxID=2060973 RepID=A0A9Q8QRS8_9HYPO|nr:uncharacterized protein JDV02_010427 [Purpureocillium takamizusanense]UNI24700.1 hypothetical protein JDV02_010427 [Purpureocillium takamizusanense]
MDRGDALMIRLLVDEGADVEPSDTDPRFRPGARRRGPLGRAVERRQEDIAMILLDAGAKPGRYTLCGKSMLHVALLMKSMTLATRLLEKGASPHDSGKSDLSPLMVAAQLGSLDLVKLLLSYGAYVEQVTANGSVMSHAVASGNVDLVDYLIKWKFPADDVRASLAREALNHKKYDVFQCLVKGGVVVDIGGSEGRELLSLATRQGLSKYVALLVESGARLSTHSNGATTPLMVLAQAGYYNLTKKLLDEGDPTEYTDKMGRTALFLAVKSMAAMDDVCKTVAALLDAGANPDIVSQGGETLLSQVMYVKRLKIAEILLSHGANIEIKNNKGRTTLSLAASRGNKQVIKFFLDHGADPTTVFHRRFTPLRWFSSRQRGTRELLENSAARWNKRVI